MNNRQISVVRSSRAATCAAVLDRLGLPDAARLAGADQADVVLALLQIGELRLVSSLVGRPVRLCPPAVPPRVPLPVPSRALGPDDRVVARVDRNPRLPTTPAYQRYRALRPGLTVRQVLTRGATRRDLRELVRSGHLEIV